MKTLLWLDDKRNPFIDMEGKVPNGKWKIIWVLNYEQFAIWIEMYGVPDAISFDHDLAEEHYTPEYFWGNYEESKKYQDWKSKSYIQYTGEECAKWLKQHCTLFNYNLPDIYIHSANPVGVDRIKNVFK